MQVYVFTHIIKHMFYTDAHCHIKPSEIAPQIAGCIYNSATMTDWQTAINIADNDDDKNFAAIGIHPWHIDGAAQDWDEQMRYILKTHPNIMVGEIGLDKFKPDMDKQLEFFGTQLEIAAQFHRPVHLHCVGAWDKILHIFKTHEKNMPPTILAHAFTGHIDLIEMLANKYNMYFSYSVPNTDTTRARVAATPKNRILVETDIFDASNQVSELDTAIRSIANLQKYDSDAMSEQIYQNFNGVISYVRSIA